MFPFQDPLSPGDVESVTCSYILHVVQRRRTGAAVALVIGNLSTQAPIGSETNGAFYFAAVQIQTVALWRDRFGSGYKVKHRMPWLREDG